MAVLAVERVDRADIVVGDDPFLAANPLFHELSNTRMVWMETPTNPLAGLSPAIRELFEALAEDIRKDDRVRVRVRWDDSRKGLLIDSRLIERYGMTGPGVASALKKVKLAFDSGNSRSLLLATSIGDFLLPRSEDGNR